MGKILEHHSKRLLRESGVAVPAGAVAENGEQAEAEARRIGRDVVLKALVPVGKRGKAGAIKFASTPEEARLRAEELLGMSVGFFPVRQVLVEEKIDIQEEWYLSVTIDKQKQLPAVIATRSGGIDVEELTGGGSEALVVHADPFRGLPTFKIKAMWSELGLNGDVLNRAIAITSKLYDVFIRYDCYILEVNPLVLTGDGQVVAAASVMGVDEAAIYRQPDIADVVELGSERAWRPMTELEKAMMAVNNADYRGTARYTEMDGGDIGFMCGGGGGSLLSFDALVQRGVQPANYTETGGNPPEDKVYGLTKGILSKPGVKGLFVAHNITNNTQVDVMAKGIVRALQDAGVDPHTFPVVVREAGVNDAEGRLIFEQAHVTYYGDDVTLEQAADKMIGKMKEVYGWRS